MFGNLKGWIISAVLLLLTAGLVYLGSQAPKPTKPTGKLDIALASMALPIDPKTLVPPGPKDADAGEELRAIAARVESKRRAFDSFDDAKKSRLARAVAGPVEEEVIALVKATQNAHLKGLLSVDQAVVYSDKPYLSAIAHVGRSAYRLATIYGSADSEDPKFKSDPKKAKQYAEASFQLGRMLYEDRIIFKQWREGVALMGNSAWYLGFLAGKTDPKAKDKFESFRLQLEKIGQPTREAWMTIYHTNQAQYPGDVFKIAETSPDPVWRTEAVLKVGRMRLMSGVSYADQIAAGELLEKISADATLPPSVKKAVELAKNLTPVSFQDVDRDP